MNICVSICMPHVYMYSSLPSWITGLNVYTVTLCNFLHFTLTLALLQMDILQTLLFNAFNRQSYTRVGNNIPQPHIRRKLNGTQHPCFTKSTLTAAVPLLHHHSSLKLNINLIKVVSQFRGVPEHLLENSCILHVHWPQQLPITSVTIHYQTAISHLALY